MAAIRQLNRGWEWKVYSVCPETTRWLLSLPKASIQVLVTMLDDANRTTRGWGLIQDWILDHNGNPDHLNRIAYYPEPVAN